MVALDASIFESVGFIGEEIAGMNNISTPQTPHRPKTITAAPISISDFYPNENALLLPYSLFRIPNILT
jgi:hypothetical protein